MAGGIDTVLDISLILGSNIIKLVSIIYFLKIVPTHRVIITVVNILYVLYQPVT